MLLALISLSGIFSDHMVLQRERANPIWGHDIPGQVVTLTVESAQPVATATVTTDARGEWRLLCPTLPVGGPYRLRLRGSSEQVVDDVLVGEVWLASGQSNMAFLLANAEDGSREIAAAAHPEIRVAKIDRVAARTPRAEVVTAWRPSTPENAAAFSAVAYYFAQEINQRTGVPVGIIDASWGGTRVEAWTSREALRTVWAGVEDELASVATEPTALSRIEADYRAKLTAWEKNAFPQDVHNLGEERGWAGVTFDDRGWRHMPLPGMMQAHGFTGNGVVWFRRTIELPADWIDHDVVLDLGTIDDFDTTYFNGERIGATGPEIMDAYRISRHYTVPARLVRPGVNTVAVRVFDRYGEGGFPQSGVKLLARSRAAQTAPVALDGDWRWEVERAIPLVSSAVYRDAPRQPQELSPQNLPSYLFNGMIAPLATFGLRGVIWYQGEANVKNHATYRERFAAMIRDWRTRWGEGTLPFYFVQLAAFEENTKWPWLREAQFLTLSEPQTGMAVAIDVGNRTDIHPLDKKTVGHRLALLARARIYGEKDLSCSGPVLDRAEITGDEMRVRFAFAEGLRTRDHAADVKGFELAGADGVYYAAEARIDKMGVVVRSAAVPGPVVVRYAWHDFIAVNLENGAGLPAVPFRTDGF